MAYNIKFSTGLHASAIEGWHDKLEFEPSEGWKEYSRQALEDTLYSWEDYEEGGSEENCRIIITDENDNEVYSEDFFIQRRQDA